MSTEQQQQQQPHQHKKEHLETNALGERLVRGWDQFKQGKLIGYRWMAVILLVGTAIGLTIYIRAGKMRERSQEWLDLEGANSLSALEKFAADHPNTTPGKIADLARARVLLGPDGIGKLVAKDEAEQKKAVADVEKGRELLTKLADEFKDDPAVKAECYYGLAKAEIALIGITKEGSKELLGSPAKAAEWLDKLAEVADGTPWGDDAKKTSASLRSATAQEIQRVQQQVYKIDLPSGGGPLPPSGSPLGGGFPGIPGLPGGLTPPVAPPSTPPTAAPKAPAPGTTPMTPTTPAPKAPGLKEPTPPAKSSNATTPTTPTPPAPKAPEPKPPAPPNK